MIEFVKHEELNLEIIVRFSLTTNKGIKFLIPEDYSQQVGYMNRPKGYLIKPHMHKKIKRNVKKTNKVLFLKKDLYLVDDDKIVLTKKEKN